MGVRVNVEVDRKSSYDLLQKDPATEEMDGAPVIGLALSGGSVLGAAHVGVLYALEEEGIRVHRVTGTSSGSIIGALYAFGTPISVIENHVRNTTWQKIGNFDPSRMGLLSNTKLGQSLIAVLGDVSIEEANIPFAAVATDIGTGERMLLREGNLASAVRASSSIPGIFQPVKWGERMLIDGGLVEHLPVRSVIELGANRVIGIDVRSREPNPAPKNVFDMLMNLSWIITHNSVHMASSRTQTIIQPDLLSYSAMDTRSVSILIEIGYSTTKQSMPDILALLEAE